MALSIFGVTSSLVRASYFADLADFAGGTTPTSTSVGNMINRAAADLVGRLAAKSVTAATISVDAGSTYPAAFAWCAGYIELGAAIRVAREMYGAGQVPTDWTKELNELRAALEKYGYLILGDAPAPSEQADGPRDWISHHSLDTGEDTDRSEAIPRFRRDDEL